MSKTTKKSAGVKRSVKNEKTAMEAKRIASVLETMINDQLLCPFPEFGSKGFADKCGAQLVNAILHEINRIKHGLCHDSKGVDNFPHEKFNLLGDKVTKSGKRPVKSSSSVPLKKRIPRKKGQKPVDEPEESDGSVHEDEPEVESKEEKKAVKKTSVAQVQRSAKNYLLFLFNNFIFEVFSIDDEEDVSNSDYVDHVLGGLLDSFSCSAGRVIIPAVEMNRSKLYDMDDDNFSNYLTTLGKKTDLNQRPRLMKTTMKYILEYTRLLGITLGNMLWSKRATINTGLLESAIRVLNIGAEQYLASHVEEPLRDLSYGVLTVANQFDITLYPPPSDEVKAARAANRKKKANEKKAGEKKNNKVVAEEKEATSEGKEENHESEEDIDYEKAGDDVEVDEDEDEDEDEEEVTTKKKAPKRLNGKS